MTQKPIEEMMQMLNQKWNVTVRTPWRTETEHLPNWEVRLVPREGHWGDYPVFHGDTMRIAVTAAMKANK